MLKIDNKKEKIEIVGDSELLKDEIGTLMLAIVSETAKVDKDAAVAMYEHYLRCMVGIADYLKEKHGIDPSKILSEEKEEEPEEEASISKEMDDAVDAFFAAIEEIIKKKKGDK